MYRTWALILKKKLSLDVLKVKLQKFQTYNPYEIWLTTCYHSALHGTIQFGVFQKLCIEHRP